MRKDSLRKTKINYKKSKIKLQSPERLPKLQIVSLKFVKFNSLYFISAKWLMQNATDGKTESSSLLSSCMTSTTMAGNPFYPYLKARLSIKSQ